MAKKRTALSLAKEPSLPTGYGELLGDLKRRVRTAQIKAARAVNCELIQLYWEIGGLIVERQRGETWGTGVIERLALDLQAEFPGITGFSGRNLFRMRSLYLVYSQGLTILPQAVAQLQAPQNDEASKTARPQELPQPVAELQTPPSRDGAILAQPAHQFAATPIPLEIANLPWGHNIVLLEKLDSVEDRLWYARQTALHGWSRSVLVAQIETEAHRRQGKALTNFDRTLPPPQSDLALRDSSRPLGVATYRLLPPTLRANLPSPEQLQAELDKYT